MKFVKRTAAALAAAVGMAALPTMAYAGVLVEYSTNGGGSYTTLCSSATNTCSGTAVTGAFTISVSSVLTNSPGTPGESDLFATTTQINNVTGSAANIIIRSGGDGFTLPTAGLLESNLAGTSTTGGSSNVVSLISCAVGSSTVTGGVPCPGGLQTASLSTNTTGLSFSTSNSVPTGGSLSTPYVLGENLNVTLTGGSNINFANSTSLVATPEPASMALLGSGLVGLVGFVRRRKNREI